MNEVELVVTALTAGLSAGVAGSASTAVQDAYGGMRDTVRRLLARSMSNGDDVLTDLETSYADTPADVRKRLLAILAEAGATVDQDVVAAARRLLAVTDPSGVVAGKYVVDARAARGVQVGDGNTQTNTFN